MILEMPKLFPDDSSGAIFDETRRYRYLLWRTWKKTQGYVLWAMLNPSTADETILDPTVRRCIGYTKCWGFGGIKVVNIFSLKSTDPKELYRDPDPVGPENNRYIIEAARGANRVIAAWGAHGEYKQRGQEVLKLLVDAGIKVECLGLTKGKMPKHPLYLKADLEPIPFSP
jgi:hypothetical protein